MLISVPNATKNLVYAGNIVVEEALVNHLNMFYLVVIHLKTPQ